MMWSTTTSIGCGTAPGPRYQITSCRYRPPGNFDGQLPYPGADTLQVPAAAIASATATAEPAPPSGADSAPLSDAPTEEGTPATAAPTVVAPQAPAEPTESSTPTATGG